MVCLGLAALWESRVVQPQIVEGRAQVGEEAPRMRAMQVADGGGEERDVGEYQQRRMSRFFPACGCGSQVGMPREALVARNAGKIESGSRTGE